MDVMSARIVELLIFLGIRKVVIPTKDFVLDIPADD
jgi:hypothetical protein